MTAKANTPGERRYYGKLAKLGLVWGFLRIGGKSLLGIPTAAILARLLSPGEFGVAAAAYFFMQLAGRLTQFGFGPSLVRVKHLKPEHLSSVFVVNLAMGTVAWVVLASSAPLIGRFFQSPETSAIMPIAAMGFLIMAFGTVPTAVLSREMRYRASTTSDWLSTVINSGVSIAFAWQGFSFWSLVYGHLAGDAVRVLVRIWAVRWWPSLRFSPTAMRELFSFGAGVYAKNLLEYAVHNLDNLVVGRLLGMVALGFYDKAFSTVNRLFNTINLSGPGVSFRIFSLIHEEPQRFRRAYRKVMLSVTMVGYPALTGMIVIAPQLIEVLFGVRWLESVLPFQMLCGAGMFKLLNMYASSATQAKGMIWSEVKRQAFFVIVLVFAVVLLSRWGIAGVAAGVLVATGVMTVLLQRLVKRLAEFTWRDMLVPQAPAVVCSLGLVTVLLATRGALGEAGAWVLLPVCLMIGALYYLGFILFSPFHAVRDVMFETADDLAPAIGKRLRAIRRSEKDLPGLLPR